MKTAILCSVASCGLGIALALAPSSASAAAFGRAPVVDFGAQGALPIERVQGYVGQQAPGRYYGRPGYRGGYYARPGYYGRGYGYRRSRVGPAIGLGIAAGALGALAAGAYAAPPAYAYPAPVYDAPPVYVAPGPSYAASADDIAYCSRRFRTYDPQSGTYIANNGRPRACP
jgi:hypothetical protein